MNGGMKMCQPITHFLAAQKGLEQLSIVQGLDAYLALGSFGPDLFYLLSGKGAHADTVHASGSFATFCNMVDVTKNTMSYSEESGRKQLVFALGFYAHVIVDCVFHPYVYRRSLDHWAKHDVIFELKHKEIEAAIDQIIQEEIVGEQMAVPNPLLCADHSGLLDQDIAYLFHQALVAVYPNSIGTSLIPYATEEANHPIQQAYQQYCRMTEMLYGAHNILFQLEKIAEGILPNQLERQFMNQEKQSIVQHHSWPPNDVIIPFTYNYLEMFKMAVSGVWMMSNTVQEFLQHSGDRKAIDFLKGQNCLYLDQDWNLDTGLPSLENQSPQLMEDGHGRFAYGIAILENNYNQLQQKER